MTKELTYIPPIFLTQEKIEEIKKELKEINSTQLPEIRKRLALAYEDGDMPENNPWITASIDLQNAMTRRNELRYLLLRAKQFQPHNETHHKNHIHLGSTIRVKINNGPIQTVTLVSSEEANPTSLKFSIDSPIGKALLEHYLGDEFQVTTPSGEVAILILPEK